jgi:hypothetical protein
MNSCTAKKRILAAAEKRIRNMDQTATVHITDRQPTPEALVEATALRLRVAAMREPFDPDVIMALALDDFAAASVKRARPTREQICWALCCGRSHCNAAEHALDHDLSNDGYAERYGCESKEIGELADKMVGLLDANQPPEAR